MSIVIVDGSSQKQITRLIVNNTERYRLILNNKLVYAKGKINFDLNLPKDGSGKVLLDRVEWKIPNSIYAIYDSGFYYIDDFKEPVRSSAWDFFRKKKGEKSNYNDLSIFINGQHERRYWNWDKEKFLFLGWYTKKGKNANGRPDGKKITDIQSVYKNTSLFDAKNNNTISTITLYAHWEIPTYTLRIRNITRTYIDKKRKRHIGYSSFIVVDENGKKKTKWGTASKAGNQYIIFRNIPYGTNIVKYLSNRITNIKYYSWGSHVLDGTSKQKELRNNPQKFLGWSEEPYATTLLIKRNSDSFSLKKDLTLYPQFNAILIYKQHKFTKGTLYYNYNFMLNSFSYINPPIGGIYYTLCNDYLIQEKRDDQWDTAWEHIMSANTNAWVANREYTNYILYPIRKTTPKNRYEYRQYIKDKNGKNITFYNDRIGIEEEDFYAYYWEVQQVDNRVEVPNDLPLYGGYTRNYIPFSSTIVCSLKKKLKYSQAYFNWWINEDGRID